MRPILEMFWVAEMDNGQALTQFAFDHFNNKFTEIENKFGFVNWKKTIRLWWMPITPRMMLEIPGTRHNPLLKRHCVELKGSKGFVTRRTIFQLNPVETRNREVLSGIWDIGFKPSPIPAQRVKCYVLGIEGGPRREIYPDGTVKDLEWPTEGETQDILHHG